MFYNLLCHKSLTKYEAQAVTNPTLVVKQAKNTITNSNNLPTLPK